MKLEVGETYGVDANVDKVRYVMIQEVFLLMCILLMWTTRFRLFETKIFGHNPFYFGL